MMCQELRRDAMATFPDDDLIVRALFEGEQQVQQLGDSLKELKSALHQQRKKFQELESLRTDFRRRRYDQAGYSFSDGALISAMLVTLSTAGSISIVYGECWNNSSDTALGELIPPLAPAVLGAVPYGEGDVARFSWGM